MVSSATDLVGDLSLYQTQCRHMSNLLQITCYIILVCGQYRFIAEIVVGIHLL